VTNPVESPAGNPLPAIAHGITGFVAHVGRALVYGFDRWAYYANGGSNNGGSKPFPVPAPPPIPVTG
jgi:hypothetical protein